MSQSESRGRFIFNASDWLKIGKLENKEHEPDPALQLAHFQPIKNQGSFKLDSDWLKSCERPFFRTGISLKRGPVTHSDEDSDSDSDDDDVQVTIGDIRTGAPSCMGSGGNHNIKSNRGYGATAKGIDFAAPGCINGLPVLEVDLDSFEEKPWRKPGADLSDYFNYGFNEATWKVYCEKQKRLQMGLDTGGSSINKENRIAVQQGRKGNSEKTVENGYVKADMKPDLATYGEGRSRTERSPDRKHGETSDITSGLVCSISRVEGRRWDIQIPEENLIEVIGDHGYKPHSIIQQHTHPPPLLPPPTIAPSAPNPPLFSTPPPPHFFHRPPPTMAPPSLHPPVLIPPPLIPPPPNHIPLHNSPTVSYSSRPAPHHSYNPTGNGPCSWNANTTALNTNKRKYLQCGIKDSGFRNYPSVSITHTPWVTTTDKGTSSRDGNNWTSRRERVQERERSRSETPTEYNEDDRYLNYSQDRNYSYEHRYRRSRERSWDREERPRREQRQRERGETSKSKSSRHKQESEERESHRRHKRKKSKRSKEEKNAGEDLVTGGNRRES